MGKSIEINKRNIRVLFMGNHTVGIEVIKSIMKNASLIGIVAHPYDAEDGIVYESVYSFGQKHNTPTIRGVAKSNQVFKFIKEKKPDLIWVTDYRYILPESIIKLARIGCINLHPSLLPKYRGRASINWAMIKGEKTIGLTAHFIDKGVDTGEIIEQIPLSITSSDYIEDVLDRLYPIYYRITLSILNKILTSKLKSTKQPIGDYQVFPKRTPDDGEIDWSKPISQILNLIRAVSRPYPGAFKKTKNTKLIIWRAENVDDGLLEGAIGEVLLESQESLFIKCIDGLLKVTDWEYVQLG